MRMSRALRHITMQFQTEQEKSHTAAARNCRVNASRKGRNTHRSMSMKKLGDEVTIVIKNCPRLD